MTNLIFQNARIIDPENNRDEIGNLYVENGKITNNKDIANAQTINCQNKILCPGLVDMRVFGGEPGAEHRETIATLSHAAAAGGITSLLMMPDTNPVIDDVALIEFILRTSKQQSLVNIYPCAALTKGLHGTHLTEMGLLQKAGAIAFGDGRQTIISNKIQKRAFTYARDFNALIISATQDKELAGKGVMHAGQNATRMGLAGIPQEAEIIPLERDMRLVSMTQTIYHASLLSCKISADIIARAKLEKLNVTAGVAVCNLTLNENDIGSYRTFYKLNPPLRSETDRLALIEAVKNGTIDIICSNHDPQDADTKRHPFAQAADGAIGLETLLAAALRLYHNHEIPLMRLLETLTCAPAKRLGINGGNLNVGTPADITIFDLEEPWVVKEQSIKSKSKNTAFEQAQFIGRVHQTFVNGKRVFTKS